MAEHRLVNDTLVVEAGGVVARCICGWESGARFTGMVASALFLDHLDKASDGKPDENLYDIARDVTHQAGMDWTDPRDGKTWPAPPPKVEG
jgi:hypothetical protein